MAIRIGYQGKLPALTGFSHADKVTHAIYGALVSLCGALLGLLFDKPVAGTLIAGTTVAFAKEIYDVVKREKDITFDTVLDILATIAPSFILALTISN